MPISGKFYTSAELQKILKVSKQQIYNISRRQNWTAISPGLYCAEDVDQFLSGRNIDPLKIPIYTYYNI